MVGRRVVELVGPPTAFPVRALVYRGSPFRDPLVCHRVQGYSVAKRQPIVVCCRSRGRRVCLALVLVVVHHAHVQLRTLTHSARLEALVKLSVVTFLSHSYPFHQMFCALWVLSPTRHLLRHVLHLVRDLVEIVFARCLQRRNPSCSRKMQICCFLGRLFSVEWLVASVLGFHCNLRDCVSPVVGIVVSIFDCRQSAKLLKGTCR